MAKFPRFESILQDSTAMKLLKSCDRKYFYRIVLGFAPKVEKYQANLDWGSIRHKFREVLETSNGDLKLAMDKSLEIKVAPAEVKFEFMNDRTRLMNMLAVDFQSYELEKDQNKIITIPGSVEQPINVQLPDGSFSAGRVDKMVEWAGAIYDLDYKTSSKSEIMFSKEKDPDDQSTRYIYMLGKLHGKPVGGIIFDVLQNSKTVENIKYKHIVTKTPLQLNQWEKEQIHINKQLELNRSNDVWPMRESSQCAWCPYVWVCRQSNERGQMDKLENEYVRKPWDLTKVEQEEI